MKRARANEAAARKRVTRAGVSKIAVADAAIACNCGPSVVREYYERNGVLPNRRNAINGKPIYVAPGTPRSCDPSTELYWSM